MKKEIKICEYCENVYNDPSGCSCAEINNRIKAREEEEM